MGNKSSTSTSTRSTNGCPPVRDVKEHIKLPKITKSVSSEIVIDHTQDDMSLVVAKKYSHSSCDLTLRMPSSPEKEPDLDSADSAPDSTFSEDLPTVQLTNL